MAFCSEMDYGVDLMLSKDAIDQFTVGDASLNESMTALIGQIAQILQTASISERVQIDNFDFGSCFSSQ